MEEGGRGKGGGRATARRPSSKLHHSRPSSPSHTHTPTHTHTHAEGVLTAVKDYNLPEHPDVPGVPNLQVIKLMQSLKSKEFVSERFAWRHYYWFLTDEGIEHLREVLALPADIVPATLKKSTRALERDTRGGDRGDRPPRRESGPGGYRGGAGRGAGGDKEVAPGAYRPSFGRGAGAPPP